MIRDLLNESSYFPLLLTIGAFAFGQTLQRKLKNPLFNPILIAAIIVGVVLISFKISIDQYQEKCLPLQSMLTPATICFAVSMYEQIGKLKKHLPAIFAGVFCGTICSLISIRLMCAVFHLDESLTVSLLPKNITTAIGMILSNESGGISSVTTAAIILTGILGNILAPTLCRCFHIHNEIACGTALGTSAHAIGTSRAAEISELAGAVSSLSLTFAGLITVLVFPIFRI